jgi:hypothetical protein
MGFFWIGSGATAENAEGRSAAEAATTMSPLLGVSAIQSTLA